MAKIKSLDVKEKKHLEKERQRRKSSDTRLPENGGKPEFDPMKEMQRTQGKGDKNRLPGWYNDPEIAKTLENIFGKKKTRTKKNTRKKAR